MIKPSLTAKTKLTGCIRFTQVSERDLDLLQNCLSPFLKYLVAQSAALQKADFLCFSITIQKALCDNTCLINLESSLISPNYWVINLACSKQVLWLFISWRGNLWIAGWALYLVLITRTCSPWWIRTHKWSILTNHCWVARADFAWQIALPELVNF